MVVNNRTVGKGDGCINEQTAQSKPPACVEANPGNMLNVCFMVKKKKKCSSGVHSIHALP